MKWQDRIAVDPLVCRGKACVLRTRIMVSVVLDNLAAGCSGQEMLSSYPTLTSENIDVCIAYAAELAGERVIPLTPGAD